MNQMSKLPTLFPEFCNTDTRMGTAEGFVTPARKRTHLKEWTVGVASPKSVKTGQHYDAMFRTTSSTTRTSGRKNSKRKRLMTLRITRRSSNRGLQDCYRKLAILFADLYGHIIRQDAERREWNINIKTCWRDGSRANGPLFPQVKTEDGRTIGFTAELLDRIKADDPAIFSCQYLNEPLIAGTQLFTEELLMRACKMYKPISIHSRPRNSVPRLGRPQARQRPLGRSLRPARQQRPDVCLRYPLRHQNPT